MLTLVALAFAADAVLSDAEWVRLRAGDVVVHADTASAETVSTGFVFIRTPPLSLWPAVLDFPARLRENGTLTGIREYRRDSPYEFYLDVDMSVVGVDVHFTNHYTCAGDTCAYTLDPARENDLERCDGWYKVEAVDGGSLLTYWSASKHRIYVPGWVRKFMAVDAVKNFLRHLKARAER